VRALILALAMGASSASAGDWATDETCVGAAGPGALRLLRALPSSPDQHSSAQWVDVDRDTKLWVRLMEAQDEAPAEYVLERGGAAIQRWPKPSMFADSPFHVLIGDLDRDGRPELVVASLGGVSNGIGFSSWTIFVFDGRDWSKRPLEFGLEEFHPMDSFRRGSEHEACGIIQSEWRPGSDTHRGWGLYLVGQRFQFDAGRLVPDMSRPVMARRLLRSFEAEFLRGRRGPGAWLADPRSERRPEVEPPAATGAAIEGVTDELVTWRFDDGSSDAWTGDAWSPEWIFGDAETGRAFPHRYRPGGTAPSLVGERVSFSKDSEGRWIAWLASAPARSRAASPERTVP
jgi:hypothetical protein